MSLGERTYRLLPGQALFCCSESIISHSRLRMTDKLIYYNLTSKLYLFSDKVAKKKMCKEQAVQGWKRP
jgi:hypothetical protein